MRPSRNIHNFVLQLLGPENVKTLEDDIIPTKHRTSNNNRLPVPGQRHTRARQKPDVAPFLLELVRNKA